MTCCRCSPWVGDPPTADGVRTCELFSQSCSLMYVAGVMTFENEHGPPGVSGSGFGHVVIALEPEPLVVLGGLPDTNDVTILANNTAPAPGRIENVHRRGPWGSKLTLGEMDQTLA